MSGSLVGFATPAFAECAFVAILHDGGAITPFCFPTDDAPTDAVTCVEAIRLFLKH